MAEWSSNLVIKFLKAYEAEPVLWDQKHQLHRDKRSINDAWDRLSSKFGIPVDDLKRKKESLMTIFRAHLKRKIKSMVSGCEADMYRPSWFAFETMERFLGNIYDNPVHIKNFGKEAQLDSGGDHNYSADKAFSATPLTVPFAQSHKGPMSELLEANNLMEQSIAALNNVLTKRLNQKDEDECDLFGRLIAQKLKKMTKKERRQTMYDIHKLIIRKKHPDVIDLVDETPPPAPVSVENKTKSKSKTKKYKIILLKTPAGLNTSNFSLPLEIQIKEPHTSQSISTALTSGRLISKKDNSLPIFVSKKLLIPNKSDIIYKAFTKAADE